MILSICAKFEPNRGFEVYRPLPGFLLDTLLKEILFTFSLFFQGIWSHRTDVTCSWCAAWRFNFCHACIWYLTTILFLRTLLVIGFALPYFLNLADTYFVGVRFSLVCYLIFRITVHPIFLLVRNRSKRVT